MLVGDILSREAITFRRDDPVDAVIRALGETSQDIFPVVDEKGKVVGTIGEMELLRALGPARQTFPFGPRTLARAGLARDVEDLMTPRPSTARPHEQAEAALKRMQELELPQLVVVDGDGKLVGLLRGRDLFRALFERGGAL